MKPILTLFALVLSLALTSQAEAQLFGRRQQNVNVQINNGAAAQQFNAHQAAQFRQQQFKAQQFRQQHFKQQAFRQQAVYVAPVQQAVVYAQPVVAQPVYVQPFVQQQAVCHGCNGGGGGLQLNTGCATFFSH